MTTLDLEALVLKASSHRSFNDGACLLEACSYMAREPWSDHPVCVSPVLGAYGRALNDVLPDDKRQLLKPLIPDLLNTTGDGKDEARSLLALDWLIRVYTPAWLRLVPALVADADLLVAHRPIDSLEAAASTGDIVREAASHSAAAGDAAGDAARAAARDALAPTVEALQDSAIALFPVLIAGGRS